MPEISIQDLQSWSEYSKSEKLAERSTLSADWNWTAKPKAQRWQLYTMSQSKGWCRSIKACHVPQYTAPTKERSEQPSHSPSEQDLYYHHLSPCQQSCKQQQQHQWQWEEQRNHTNDSHQYQKLQVLTASTTRKQWKLMRKLRKQLWQTKLRQCKLVPSQGLESPWLLSHAHPRVV